MTGRIVDLWVEVCKPLLWGLAVGLAVGLLLDSSVVSFYLWH